MEDVPLYNLHYLVRDDFDNNGDLTNEDVPKNIPVLIMMQSSNCPYCVEAKPEFQKFIDKTNKNNVFCATIQTNGYKEKEEEIKLGSHMQNIIPKHKGVPEYLLYFNTKLIAKKDTPGRSAKDLTQFCKSYTNLY
jgi:thiol-disulfide isomerase/thioredoxin